MYTYYKPKCKLVINLERDLPSKVHITYTELMGFKLIFLSN